MLDIEYIWNDNYINVEKTLYPDFCFGLNQEEKFHLKRNFKK